MTQETGELIRAFGEDHAILGHGFHRISTALRAGALGEARRLALELDARAGAHIVFEEEHFYPCLRSILGTSDVDRLYREHDDGLDVLRRLEALEGGADLPVPQRAALLAKSEAMERHIAECGELFEAIGRIPPTEQAALFYHLTRLRREEPGWTAYSNKVAAIRSAGEPQK